MSRGDGLSAEMRRLLHKLGADPLDLDDDSADRLLAGRLDPADAPPGYAEVAVVMAAVAAPGSPHELAGAASTLEAFRAAADPRPVPPRRARMLVKLLTVKAAAAVFSVALMGGGVAAAATGSLPDPAQRLAHRMVGAAPSPTDQGRSADHSSAGKAKGPDATGAAMKGLCTAWLAGQGGANGGKNDSVAFQALAAAAGGADKIADFCKDPAHSTGQAQQGQGKPADPSSAGTDRGQSGEHTTAPDDHTGSQPPTDPGSQGQRDDHAPAPPTSSPPQP